VLRHWAAAAGISDHALQLEFNQLREAEEIEWLAQRETPNSPSVGTDASELDRQEALQLDIQDFLDQEDTQNQQQLDDAVTLWDTSDRSWSAMSADYVITSPSDVELSNPDTSPRREESCDVCRATEGVNVFFGDGAWLCATCSVSRSESNEGARQHALLDYLSTVFGYPASGRTSAFLAVGELQAAGGS